MANSEAFQLNNIDPEDICDVLRKVQKSFDLKFGYTDFENAKTYGDICDIIINKINCENSNDDCTSQQAFYKIREAIATTQLINKSLIHPSTPLEQLFPRIDRRKKVKIFSDKLNLKIDILSMKLWLLCVIVVGFITSIFYFLFNYKWALSGLLLFTIVNYIGGKFSKELDSETVGGLTKKLSREHYSHFRTVPKTINRREIQQVIDNIFMNDLGLEKEQLHINASLGW